PSGSPCAVPKRSTEGAGLGAFGTGLVANRTCSTPSVSVPAHSEPSRSSNIERTYSEMPSTRPSSTQRPCSYLNDARPSRSPIQTRAESTAETLTPYELNDRSFGVLIGTAVVPVI